jgi:hypothetical protein
MRFISHHKVNGLNEAILISAQDERGSGGANHHYLLALDKTGPELLATRSDQIESLSIKFQNGPIKEAGYNGFTNEALLAVLIDRMEGFVNGPFNTTDNEDALANLRQAMYLLQKRTKDRLSRGVEGTHQA